jgi:hypothetical protein
MRIGYSEDEDYPGQFELWQANCRRSLQGKAGQTALRELEQALLALPEKRLIAGELENAEGEVCAIGALVKYRGVEETKADPDCDMEDVGVELGMPRLVAWKVVALNDMEIDGHYVMLEGPIQSSWSGGGHLQQFVPVTPEERYERVLAWVRKQSASGSNTKGVAVA